MRKNGLVYRIRSWVCFTLFEDVVENCVQDVNLNCHRELDKLGIPQSRIQPNGPCYDGLLIRIRDALTRTNLQIEELTAEIKRQRGGLDHARRSADLQARRAGPLLRDL